MINNQSRGLRPPFFLDNFIATLFVIPAKPGIQRSNPICHRDNGTADEHRWTRISNRLPAADYQLPSPDP